MSKKSKDAAYRKAAELILAGRYGRACRVVAKETHGMPRLLQTKEEREAWARKVLAQASS